MLLQIERKAVSVAEAAEMIGVSINKAYQMVHAGELPAKHCGKRWLVPVAALERWLEEA